MSSANSENSETHETSVIPTIVSTTENKLVVLNAGSQLYIKLDGDNYPAWRIQFFALLTGFDLMGYVDGTNLCPSKMLENETSKINPAYTHWVRQDQLILHGVVSSVAATVVTHLGTVKTSKEAWDTLQTMYAGRSRVRIMALKQKISTFTKGDKPMANYLQGIKAISDELSIINHPLDDTDLVIHTLNGLSADYREISTALRSRETPVDFAQLHEKLMDFEIILHRDNLAQSDPIVATANAANHYRGVQPSPNHKQQGSRTPYQPTPTVDNRVVCQFCNKSGHTARKCYKIRGYPKQPGGRTSANTAIHHPGGSNASWIMDTGASHHVTQDLQQLTLSNPYPGADQLVVGDGTGLNISHIGTASIKTPSKPLHLHKVLTVPKIASNLLSVSKLCKSNHCSVEFFSDCFVVKDLTSGQVLLQGPVKQDLYHLPTSLTIPSTHKAFTSSIQSTSTWHHKLGHPSSKIMKHLVSSHHIPISPPSSHECSSCHCAKSHKLPFSNHHLNSSRPLELIYSDVWGPSPVRSLDGYSYYLVFVDHFSKYVWLYPMKYKSDVFSIFIQFKTIVEKYFNLPIITLFSDNGGEFIKLKSFLATHGISHLTTPPHTPEVNGTSERRHRHIVETGRALLHHAQLPAPFWSFAFQTATYLINRMPTPNLKMKSPHEVLFNENPDYTKLHSFGCLCFPWLKPYTKNKLQNRSFPCIFLGYSKSQHASLCLEPISNRIYTSRHVRFIEDSFPYKSLVTPTLPHNYIPPIDPTLHTIISNSHNSVPTPTLSSHPSETSPNPHMEALVPAEEQQPLLESLSTSSSGNNSLSQPLPPLNVPNQSGRYHVVTRSQNNIFKPKKLFTITKHELHENLEPSTVTQALKIPHWRKACSEEFDALLKNGTWTLVPRDTTINLVGCKWLFRIKRNPNGTIARYKARLVAKGYTQTPGVDFKETFAPVVKPQTIKVVITLALTYGWSMHQLDVNNAFLQGNLTEDVFMEQPPGFIHSEFPNHVCKLKKAIYGLRQAPRAWHDALKSFVLSYGFTTSLSDSSLFTYNKDGVQAFLLVYVDDIIVTGSQTQFLNIFINELSTRFSIKNLGFPHYFLGVELVPTKDGILLSQHGHIRELLLKFKMAEAKPVATPLCTSTPLKLLDGSAAVDAKQFRSIIGGLQYLTITRPDLSFAVNKLSQFMHQPTELHLQQLKRILRYLKLTINHGLSLKKPQHMQLHAFSDADWAGNLDDRTSTSAYIIYLGGNPISWLSKRQRTVARSSTEAEYRSVAQAAAEVMWLINLLGELGIKPQTPTLFCDNIGATYLCSNPVFHSRMKHIALDFHYVRQLVQMGKLKVSHISTKDQLADILTKPLPRPRFTTLRDKIGVTDCDPILRGHIKEIH